jgi:2-methylaconitate cis-trans-isomerase PrpF
MNTESVPIKCAIMRGGTSKAVFIMDNELPRDSALRDKAIAAIFGSPDVRQIDGLGGADVLTSKLAIIAPASIDAADVDYTFGQVGIDTGFIDYKGNCGNISSAVGPFAIDAGLISASEPFTTVRIHLTNSGKILTAEVPVSGGKPAVEGAYSIDGVPGTGARIGMDWSDTVGAFTGKLLPTGNATDVIETDEGAFAVSLVDAGNPLVFIEASSLGLAGTESPSEIEGNAGLMASVEKLRAKAAAIFGLVEDPADAADKSPYNPFFAIVSPPASYRGLNGTDVDERDVDIVSRLIFMHRMHKAYPITGTVCTAAAAMTPGSIVDRMMRAGARAASVLRIGHPGGVVDVEKRCRTDGGVVIIERIAVGRTARKIMEGLVYIKRSAIEE